MKAAKIGKRIEYFLDMRNITAYGLGKKIKMSMSTLYPYIRGTRKPSIDSLEKICKGLDITLSEFFEDPDHRNYYLLKDEEVLIDTYRSIEARFQNRVLGYAKSFTEMETE